MENNKDYEIKVVGEKNSYGNGAIRYVKNKGRFDLIQPDVLERIVVYMRPSHSYYTNKNGYIIRNNFKAYLSPIHILSDAFNSDDIDFTDIIIRLSLYKYADITDDSEYSHIVSDIMAINSYKADDPVADVIDDKIAECIRCMLMELAIHFQKGAEKYGVRNCEKGIPAWSFRDSGLRHLTQYLNHTDDGENHFIAAIWNFWMLDWTANNCSSKSVDDGYEDDDEPLSPKEMSSFWSLNPSSTAITANPDIISQKE